MHICLLYVTIEHKKIAKLGSIPHRSNHCYQSICWKFETQWELEKVRKRQEIVAILENQIRQDNGRR